MMLEQIWNTAAADETMSVRLVERPQSTDELRHVVRPLAL